MRAKSARMIQRIGLVLLIGLLIGACRGNSGGGAATGSNTNGSSGAPETVVTEKATTEPVSPLSSPMATPVPAAQSAPSALVEKGKQLFGEAQYEAALDAYTQAIDKGQDLGRAYAGRGDVYNALRRFDQAMADYSAALEYKRTADVLIGRCNANRLLQNYDQAIEDCDEAAGLEPGNASAHVVLASLYLDQGKTEQAREQALLAQEADPDLSKTPYVLGLIDLAEGKPEDAIDHFTQAIDLDRFEPAYYWERGFLYLALGRVEEARADMKSVLEVGDPERDGELMLQAGSQLRVLGD